MPQTEMKHTPNSKLVQRRQNRNKLWQQRTVHILIQQYFWNPNTSRKTTFNARNLKAQKSQYNKIFYYSSLRNVSIQIQPIEEKDYYILDTNMIICRLYSLYWEENVLFFPLHFNISSFSQKPLHDSCSWVCMCE